MNDRRVIQRAFEHWDDLDPILEIGDIGIISAGQDLGKMKEGDGVTRWNELPYSQAGMGGSGGTEADPIFTAARPSLATKQDISQEAAARNQQINEAITNESNSRELQVTDLNEELQETNHVLAGVHTTALNGATLTRVLSGTTTIAKSLFAANTVFMEGKTLIFDSNGTVGVYIGDYDSSTINILTKTIAPIGMDEPTLLGQVDTFAELPFTVQDAEALFGRTPNLGDHVQVKNDETHNDKRVEWYISEIENGDITWGNPVIINDSDYQTQTSQADAGRVLTGGATPGTFGKSIGIDMEPFEDSENLVKSGGVFSWIGGELSSLLTSAKNMIGAINEVFNNKQNIISTTGNTNLLTAPAAVGGQPGTKAISDFVQITGTQSITGNKTFSGTISFSGTITVPDQTVP